MADYRLSARAEGDLLDIFIYTIERFGLAQAEHYQHDLTLCFDLLAENPGMGRQANAVAEGVRRHEHGRHVIFYEVTQSGILILALIHAASLKGLAL